ncbi:BRCA1-associated protein-like [Notothenia coriiceps]|uniref:BRCA1-associated protein-like n=1 Tax=Notothenia coriiceps TaxID=8208 RepID=A0A6I9NDL0_9TELE|nr:PREDICTED: BRCA1-associated protein-like [Notothenia coriiceps]
MTVSMVVIRLEIADQSPSPQGFQYSAEGMSEKELQEKALGVAKHTLSGKTDLERAAVLHQHIGSRAMGDMVIETFEPSQDKRGGEDFSGAAEQDSEAKAAQAEADSPEGSEASHDTKATGATPDSPSKQLPDQISFFSGNPSVEIVHGIMHLYKTK